MTMPPGYKPPAERSLADAVSHAESSDRISDEAVEKLQAAEPSDHDVISSVLDETRELPAMDEYDRTTPSHMVHLRLKDTLRNYAREQENEEKEDKLNDLVPLSKVIDDISEGEFLKVNQLIEIHPRDAYTEEIPEKYAGAAAPERLEYIITETLRNSAFRYRKIHHHYVIYHPDSRSQLFATGSDRSKPDETFILIDAPEECRQSAVNTFLDLFYHQESSCSWFLRTNIRS